MSENYWEDVISQETYKIFKQTNKFPNKEDREAFLQDQGLRIVSTEINFEKSYFSQCTFQVLRKE